MSHSVIPTALNVNKNKKLGTWIGLYVVVTLFQYNNIIEDLVPWIGEQQYIEM